MLIATKREPETTTEAEDKFFSKHCKHAEMYVELTGLLAEVTCLHCGCQWYKGVRVYEQTES